MENKSLVLYSMSEITQMGTAIAKSGLFGIKTVEQAIALCLIAQAEGRHPALAARDYDIIQGRPAKKAEAMHRDFLAAGGEVIWLENSDTKCAATFIPPKGSEVTIEWDLERAAKAGLASKDMFRKFPRQMLRSRVISEGVRTAFPLATSGMYVPEEVREFAPEKKQKQVVIEETEVVANDVDPNAQKTLNEVKTEIIKVCQAIGAMQSRDPNEVFAELIDNKKALLGHIDAITVEDERRVEKLADAVVRGRAILQSANEFKNDAQELD
jgi:hypothetical protein